ncbi:HNH endonuclease [Dyadobacter sp. CY356]|uniref:HNH endonuclease n=1 Tax=Dyadobacter sp. CY356 TaxID=2906442 RepID=UPI001F273750|nr:HNH endonuclease [Dyadobacter sp. CY356]MCF0057725.1 HNH endonuclease [Dyadobacter sp. CY356]
MGKVLVLNQDYSALSVCTVPKAFLLVYLNKAELLAESPTHFLRTVRDNYPMPVVIRLNSYIHLPYRGVVMTRHNIFKRDGNRCQYCGTHDHLTLDHVMPKSRGGKTTWDNLATACKRCNSKKGDYTPEEAGMHLRQRPFRPSFLMFIRDFSGFTDAEWLPYLGVKERAVN